MGFILVIHVIVCVLLVICILMQAGRGGGLTETFQSAESMFGTQTNAFMVRMTTIFAVIFLSTSLILAFNSSKRDKSLMANKKLLATVPSKDVPVSPVTNAAK
jgi:preprotein translocase subunit SecG